MSAATPSPGRWRCIQCQKRWTDRLQCAECRGEAPPPPASEPEGARPAVTTSEDPRDAAVLEAEIQRAGIEAMERAGWTVYRIGQQNAEGTQDPGPGDTVCFHERLRLAAWVEWKRPVGGRQSAAQREFERLCRAAGWPYVLASQVAHVATLHLTLAAPETAGAREPGAVDWRRDPQGGIDG